MIHWLIDPLKKNNQHLNKSKFHWEYKSYRKLINTRRLTAHYWLPSCILTYPDVFKLAPQLRLRPEALQCDTASGAGSPLQDPQQSLWYKQKKAFPGNARKILHHNRGEVATLPAHARQHMKRTLKIKRAPLFIRFRFDQNIFLPLLHPQKHKRIQAGLRHWGYSNTKG